MRIHIPDYAAHEYGVTPVELDKFIQRVGKELDADRKARRLKPFRGKLNLKAFFLGSDDEVRRVIRHL